MKTQSATSADRVRLSRRRKREGVVVFKRPMAMDAEGLRRWLDAEGIADPDLERGFRRLVAIMCRSR